MQFSPSGFSGARVRACHVDLSRQLRWSSGIFSGGGRPGAMPLVPGLLLFAAMLLAPVLAPACEIALSWQDNATNESGYKIERATDGVSFVQIGTVGANIRTFKDTTAAAATTYWFRVRAYNAAGNSPYSNLVTTSTPLTGAVISAPTISTLADRSIARNTSTGPVAFTVADKETAAGNLKVTATSSNPTLVAANGLVLGGSGASRTLSVTPVANQSGTATITVTVSDGTLMAAESFVLTVNAVNQAPTISDFTDRTINAGTTTGAIAFTVGDVETAAGALVITATSSNTILLPASGIVLGGTGANRTITAKPAAGKTGTATITVKVSDGTASASETFSLTVTTLNTAPTISNLTDVTINEDGSTGARTFTIGDAQTAAGSLSVTATSSNQTLVPASALAFGGSGAYRTLAVKPAANQNGSATISVNVSDGSLTTTDTFVLTVKAVNDAPMISNVPDRTITAGTSTDAIAFTVGDIETAAGNLTVSAVSSSTWLVPATGMVFGGTDANRTITVKPAAGRTGTATITVRVSDGVASASDGLVLTVKAANTAPTISNLTDVTINEDGSTGARAFTVGDAQTAAGSLTVTATSSNSTLVPVSGLVFGGSGASRTLAVTPAANQNGSATITVKVSDGALTATDTFGLIVKAVNDAPTISAIANRSIERGGGTGAISFTVGDAETAAGNLALTASSSNQTLVPLSGIVFGGSGGNRTVTVTPVAWQSGTVTITVKAGDGALSSSRAFTLTVSFASQIVVSGDIGSPSLAGTTKIANGIFTISAAGADIWNVKDQFHFARQQFLGDAELIVRVGSLVRTHDWAKAGLMFRADLSENAAHVSVVVSAARGVALQWRPVKGGVSKTSKSLPGAVPEWLRLVRTGDTFYAFRSENGVDWELVEFVQVNMPEVAFGGMALCAVNAQVRTTATFEHFEAD